MGIHAIVALLPAALGLVTANPITARLEARSGYISLPHGQGFDWPGMEAWKSFDELWAINQYTMDIGCSWMGVASTHNFERDAMYGAIKASSQDSGVDERVILAVIMQESNGCVRVKSTSVTHNNPGLMQSHMGAGTCGQDGWIRDPCPDDMISLMVRDGALGTAFGNGLMQTIRIANDRGFGGAPGVYWGARMYNSGENIAMDDLYQQYMATSGYAEMVANRLMGWDGIS